VRGDDTNVGDFYSKLIQIHPARDLIIHMPVSILQLVIWIIYALSTIPEY